MTDISVSCPEARRAQNRRKKLKNVWRSPEWKRARSAFIQNKGGKCEWCGREERLTVHHPFMNSYTGDIYLDFSVSECILLCSACHKATHQGLELCKREHPDMEYHYRKHDASMCNYCWELQHPEIKLEKARVKEEKKEAAKARRRVQSQKAKIARKKWKDEHPIKKKNGVS